MALEAINLGTRSGAISCRHSPSLRQQQHHCEQDAGHSGVLSQPRSSIVVFEHDRLTEESTNNKLILKFKKVVSEVYVPNIDSEVLRASNNRLPARKMLA